MKSFVVNATIFILLIILSALVEILLGLDGGKWNLFFSALTAIVFTLFLMWRSKAKK